MRSATRTIEFERRLHGSPEIAFTYFTDPEKHLLWQGIDAQLDPTPGGNYVVHISPRVRIRGRYVELSFPRRIVIEWGIESDPGAAVPPVASTIPEGSTTVEISFTPDGDGTILRVVHSGLPGDDAAGFTGYGWLGYLPRLVRVSAGEEPGPDPFTGVAP